MFLVPVPSFGSTRVFSFAYMGSHYVSSGSSPDNHTGLDLGAAASDRVIIAGVGLVKSGTQGTMGTVTIGGVTSTVVDNILNPGTDSTRTALVYANVPTGTTGTISVPWTTTDETMVNWWRATGITAAPTQHVSNTVTVSNASSGSLTIPSGGFGIGFVLWDGAGSPRTATWSNLTERFEDTDNLYTSKTNITQAAADSLTAGTLTRTVQASGSLDGGVLLLAAWGP